MSLLDHLNTLIAKARIKDHSIKTKIDDIFALIELLKTDYSEALYNFNKKDVMLWRGTSDLTDMFINKSGIRVSQNSNNFYTSMISEILPSWKEYPKRNKCTIMSGAAEVAEKYADDSHGNLYLVLPKNGALIALCPTADMWDAFGHNNRYTMIERMSISKLAYFDNAMVTVIASTLQVDKEDIENKFASNNSGAILDVIKAFEDKAITLKKEDPEYTTITNEMDNFEKGILNKVMSGEKFIDIIDILLNPYYNGFKLLRLSDLTEDIVGSKELWTESECIYTIPEMFEKAVDTINGENRVD